MMGMQDLEPPDNFHVSAASGWLELDNLEEARQEFAKIREASRGHADALEVEWRLEAAECNWDGALKVAERQIKADADCPYGWINQSYCLHELKRTKDAWDRLWSVSGQFQQVGVLHYNLASYSCQLGQLEVAKKCLKLAVQCQSKAQIKRMALGDEDLKPLEDFIRAL